MKTHQILISCEACGHLTEHKPVVVNGEAVNECLVCGAQTHKVLYYVRRPLQDNQED